MNRTDENARRDALMRAVRLIEEVGAELSKSTMALVASGAQLETIVSIDEAEAGRRSSLARGWLSEASALERALLPPAMTRTLDIVAATAGRIAQEEQWYWLVYDPSGFGFFNLFGPTGYGEMHRLNEMSQLLKRQRLASAGDSHRYCGLLADLAQVIRGMQARLAGQAARGVRMPNVQVAQVVQLIGAARPGLAASLAPAIDRCGALPNPAAFVERARTIIADEIVPALDALCAWLKDTQNLAPSSVGMSQYPGGRACYEGLVRLHTTQNLSPEEVHARGHARIKAIMSEMRALCDAAGFAGSPQAYRAALASAPDCQALDEAAVRLRFEEVVARAEPCMPKWFHSAVQAPYGVSALPEELTASVTFGYYKPPSSPRDAGAYVFNAPNIIRQGTATVAAITYHELIPGHHLHIGVQTHDPFLPAALRFSAFNAFAEGWAEYAATLAGEAGLYRTPAERFGRLIMDAFLTTRLVVDTGLNALDWSLEQARDYMREHAFMSEAEVRSESVRYSCDMPGQALAYKLGDTFILEQRERMRAALGASFDVRDFHAMLLADGGMPMPLIEQEVDRVLAALNT